MLKANSYSLKVFVVEKVNDELEALLSCAGDKVIMGDKDYSSNFSVLYSSLRANKSINLPRCIDLDLKGK